MRSLFIAILFALLFPVAVMAQSLGDSLNGSLDASLTSANSFTVSVNPQYPLPYSEARISLLSSTLDLTNATLTVSAAGKQIYRGSVQPVSIPLGKAGSVVSLSVTVSSGGGIYTQHVVIQPEDVALIAEPLSSAPALYPGKSFVPLEGSTRIVAMANFRDASGKVLDPASLSYAWTVDDTQIANSSGIGKQAIVVTSPLQYRSRDVSVIVQSQSGSLVGGGSLSLIPTEPTIRMYKNDPLLGVLFDRALSGGYTIAGAEDTLYAAPFSLPLAGSAPHIAWLLNGASAETGNIITLRPTGAGQGNATLSVTASAGATTEATADLSLTFGAKPSTHFFGL